MNRRAAAYLAAEKEIIAAEQQVKGPARPILALVRQDEKDSFKFA